jgi:hypothetical protein
MVLVEDRPMRLQNVLRGVVLAFAMAGAAQAGSLYRWTNSDGVVAFSDDLKRIPEAYRASALPVKTASLATYKRYTPARAAESQSYRERLEAHVERMRALNDSVTAERLAAMPQPKLGSVGDVRVNRKLQIALPEEVRANGEPVVVEEHRVRNGDTTTHVYIVRQGDRVLSVMRPHTNQSGTDWPELEELLGDE